MKKSELREELSLTRQENIALAQRARDLRATNLEMVNNFAGEIAQTRYERDAALQELEESREWAYREIGGLKRTVVQLQLQLKEKS